MGGSARDRPDQLGNARLIEVAGEQKPMTVAVDVQDKAAGVVRGVRVPAGGWVQDAKPGLAVMPGCRRGDRADGD